MESDESEWEPELLESHLVGHDPENEEFEVLPPVQPSKRGPKKLPVMWSRVIAISQDSDADIGVFNIEFDLKALLTLPRPPILRRNVEWAPIFLPTSYSKAHPDISLDSYALGVNRLRYFGTEVSRLREELRKAALEKARQEADE